MKKILLLLMIGVLLGNCGAVFAKAAKKGKPESKQKVNIDKKSRNKQAESKRAKLRKGAKRASELKQRPTREQIKQRRMGQAYSPKDMKQSQQLEATKNKIAQETAKHSRRMARLNRIRVLAKEGNDPKTLARVDKLLKKENRRFIKKQNFFKNKSQKLFRTRRSRTGPDAKRGFDPEKAARRARPERRRGEPGSRKKDLDKKSEPVEKVTE